MAHTLPLLISESLDQQLDRAIVRECVPEFWRDELLNYARYGVPTGSFLQAVLSNELAETFNRADVESRRALPQIVAFVYNVLPYSCWGSRAIYQFWLTKGQEARQAASDRVVEDAGTDVRR